MADETELFQGEPLPEKPTHADIMRAVQRVEARESLRIVADQRRDTALAELKTMLRQVLDAIGTEGKDEYGKPVGTGLTGRIMREELRWGWFDGLRRYALGATAATTICILIIWWLVMPYLERLFHPGAN